MQMEMLDREYPEECRHWIHNNSDTIYWAQVVTFLHKRRALNIYKLTGSIYIIKTSVDASIGQKNLWSFSRGII